MVWILHQIAGLAKGLQEIHDNSKNFKPEKAPSLEPGMNLQSKVGNWLIGYHHDIKPQNILHFKRLNKDITTPSPEYGVYQIADFGVGKFYQHMSDYSPGTIHHRGTITYAAPESRISYSDSGNVRSKGNLHLSRPYDVWSFGCVVMETLVWLILGKREWIQFNEKRFGNVIEDNNAEISDAFWVASDGLKKAYVKPVVKKMLSDLRDSERVKKSESFAGMVDLVENILDVNPRTRIAIPNVVGRLEAILRGTGHDNGLDDYPESLSSTGRSTPTVSITEPNDEIPITHVDMQNLLPPARTLPNPKRSSLKRLMARATPSGHSDGRPPIV
jgi:serine/threonine protein kinase